MNKHLKRLLFLSLVLLISACSIWEKEEATRTFYIEEGGIELTLVYTYRGDEVLKQSTETIIEYETFDLETKDEAEEVFSRFINNELGNIDGKTDRKSTRLNSSHVAISYAVFCLKKKKKYIRDRASNVPQLDQAHSSK